MAVAAVGTFLIGQLSPNSPGSMLAVVGGSLALALAFGLIAFRPGPRSASAA
jgi:hypothetical protein